MRGEAEPEGEFDHGRISPVTLKQKEKISVHRCGLECGL